MNLRVKTSDSTVKIRAPARKVWLALTSPALVKQWQYGSDLLTTWEANESAGGDDGPDVLSILKELVEVKIP
jgi:uncharacterized protein YndB with AHSA1/START domain